MFSRIQDMFFEVNWRSSILPTGPALLLTLGGILLSACSAGTNFERPSADAIVLGKTTPDQITKTMGKPWKKLATESNGKKLEVIIYSYAEEYSPVGGPNAALGRTIQLTFADGRLAGHEFFSSFKNDHTDFDVSRIKEIRKSAHSTEDVLHILGAPTGQQVYPLIDDAEQLRWSYRYQQIPPRGIKVQYVKILHIYFDKNRKVKNLNFEEKGKR